MNQEEQQQLNSVLFNAADYGDPKKVAFALNIGAQVNALNNKGQTPLLVAVETGHFLAMDMLIRYGGDVRIVDNQGVSCLDMLKEQLAVARYLDEEIEMETLIQKVNFLMKNGPLPARPVWESFSQNNLNLALYDAVSVNDFEETKRLVEAGADVFFKVEQTPRECILWNEKGKVLSVLDVAKANNNQKIVSYLEEKRELYQSFIEKVALNDVQGMQDLLDKGAHLKACDKEGTPALVVGVKNNAVAATLFLLNNGVDANMADKQDKSALMWAAEKEHVSLVSLLLQYGAERKTKDAKMNTAFYYAAENGSLESAKELIDLSEVYEIKSAIRIATKQAKEEMVDYLSSQLARGKKIFAKPIILLQPSVRFHPTKQNEG
jgi:ankyrin repeat protein